MTNFEQTKAAIMALPDGWGVAKVGRRGPVMLDLSTTDLQSLITDLEGERDALRKELTVYQRREEQYQEERQIIHEAAELLRKEKV